jgi:hypothetical protein
MTDAPRYQPVDLSRLETYSVAQRGHRADANRLAKLPEVGASAAELLRSFPPYLGADQFGRLVTHIAKAVRTDRPVVAAFGAHVVKVGCGPILVDLMERGIVRALAMHGAVAIHDAELALFGATSEDVGANLHDGKFGMVRETMEFFDEVVRRSTAEGIGLGAAVGKSLHACDAPNAQYSVLATAHRLNLPATVHVAVGTDTVHMSGGMDMAALGTATGQDFRLICAVVADLGAAAGDLNAASSDIGGVWLNLGSAVLLPEVFLKAVSVARNLGANLDALVTANLDMLRHYRPHNNVVTRPVREADRGLSITGHHEILLPLLRLAILEELAGGTSAKQGTS